MCVQPALATCLSRTLDIDVKSYTGDHVANHRLWVDTKKL